MIDFIKRLHDELFGLSALSVEAIARRQAEQYGQRAREAYGAGVPLNEISDFEDGFCDAYAGRHGKPWGECSGSGEGYYIGYQAGVRYLDQSAGNAGGEGR